MLIGRSIRETDVPLKDEIEFTLNNKYDIAQIWYKQGHINSLYELSAIETIKNSKLNFILHAAMDINDFDLYSEDLISKLIELNHKELILHPMIKTKKVNKYNDKILTNKVIEFANKLNKLNIKVYVENNHDYMQTFYTLNQWKYFFKNCPDNVELLIDITHVLFCNDYNFLREMVKIKYPKALHVSDTVKGMIGKKHLHLPIGKGIVDFNIVFNDILKDFDGILILEINNTDELIIDSKNKIEKIINCNK